MNIMRARKLLISRRIISFCWISFLIFQKGNSQLQIRKTSRYQGVPLKAWITYLKRKRHRELTVKIKKFSIESSILNLTNKLTQDSFIKISSNSIWKIRRWFLTKIKVYMRKIWLQKGDFVIAQSRDILICYQESLHQLQVQI